MSLSESSGTISTTVEFSGWWGQKSALIRPDSILYRLKKRFLHILETDYQIANWDRPNSVPHVALTTDQSPQNHDNFQQVEGLSLVLTPETALVADPDHIQIPFQISTSNVPNVHMTLFFMRGIGQKHGNLLQQVYRRVLLSLINEPDRPEDHIQTKFESQITHKAPRVKRERKSKSKDKIQPANTETSTEILKQILVVLQRIDDKTQPNHSKYKPNRNFDPNVEMCFNHQP